MFMVFLVLLIVCGLYFALFVIYYYVEYGYAKHVLYVACAVEVFLFSLYTLWDVFTYHGSMVKFEIVH